MNATRRDRVPLLRIVATSVLIVACGGPSNEADKGTKAAPPEPLVTAPRVEPRQSRQLTTTAGGIASRYTPTFEGDRLMRIDEAREHGSAQAALGSYTFHGARLMRYEGPPLEGTDTLLLEFDLQGKVITARHGDQAATEAQISAIRTRAQLLRNHALTNQISRTHAAE